MQHDRADGSRTIYQLKFFPEGFSGGFASRRKQIQRSFHAAMAHKPDGWALVVPCTMTQRERAFIQSLPGREQPPVDVLVDYIDEPRLDAGMAGHPDLIALFTRDELREFARQFGREKAALEGGVKDLHDQIQGLGGLAAQMDPHWDIDFAREGDQVVQRLRAKTPDAATQSPISIRVSATFGEGQEACGLLSSGPSGGASGRSS